MQVGRLCIVLLLMCSAIQRMVAGMTLAAVSFIISGVLQMPIDVCMTVIM